MEDERCDCDVDPVCIDCGVDTNAIHEYYMVRDKLWEQAVPDSHQQEGQLCIGCLESRLNRQLYARDFTDAPVNLDGTYSPRLQDRLEAVPPAEFEAGKQKLLAHLRELPDRDAISMVCGCGHHNLSINMLIDEVERGTQDGRDWVRLSMAMDRRIEAAARKPWNRIRSFFRRLRAENLHVKP